MTKAIFSILMITALAYGARSFVPAGETITGSGAALAFGFLLIAALQIGHIAEKVRFPHLTGYLLGGLLFGPEVLGIISRAMVNDLTLIKGTAVGLIALLAGCELNFRSLRPALRAITSIAAITIFTAMGLLWGLFYWIVSVLPATAGYTGLERLAVALVCANVLAAFSPAVVIGVINETRARGPLSQLCMSVVVLADLAMVISFALTSSWARSIFPGAAASGGMWTVVEHIGGSIVVGLLIGLLLAAYIRKVHNRTGLVIVAILFIVAEAGRVLHLDPLLVGLAAGLLVENASPVSGETVTRSLSSATLPTFAIFFAVVGAEIHLRAFFHVAPFALIAAVVRAVGIFTATRVATHIGGVPRDIARLVPLGLLPQAGVAIALAVLVLNSAEPWGRVMGTVLLGSIVVNELIGPVLFRWALAKAGEIAPDDSSELAMPVPQLHPR